MIILRMILCLTLLLGMISFAKGSTTNKRDICTTVYQNFYECTRKAYQDYETIILNGDDGRKDWDPRKTCNYMNTAIDVSVFEYEVSLEYLFVRDVSIYC